MNRTRHLLRSSLIVILLYGLNKLTGFARIIFVGDLFGTSAEADAFAAANQLPELFYVLVAGGALAAALIPVYSKYLTSEQLESKSLELANTVLTVVLLLLILICGITALFAPALTRYLLVPSYSPAQQQLVAELMRIILINTSLFGISGVISSLLNAHQHFILPALAPIALDVGYFIGVFLLVPSFGIYGLAWGTVVGALLHIAIQMPALVRYRLALRPRLALRLPGVHEIARLMGPRIIMLGAVQAADIFIIRVASQLPQGTVSGYFYAFTLMQLPETLFGTALAIVVFPTLAELYNAGAIDRLKQTAMTTLRVVWLLTVPSAAALVLLGRPAIALILERGEFDAASTRLVYSILIFFSLRVVSEASLEVVARLFYARHNTLTPMYAYLVWLVVNVGLVYLLVDTMGIGGIALASTVAFTVLSLLLFVLNRRELGPLHERELLHAFGRAALATVVMSAAILAVAQLALPTVQFLLIGAVVGGATYIGVYLLLGGQEIRAAVQLARR